MNNAEINKHMLDSEYIKFLERTLNLISALYVSASWYEHWRATKKIHSKARAIVVFDRILCTNFKEIEKL